MGKWRKDEGMKKLIYIAAPYTHPDPVENTHRVIKVAEDIIRAGHIPYIPHLNLLWHIVVSHPPEFWYTYDLEILKRCDILLRLDGLSEGADREVKFAENHKIPIIYSLRGL